MRHVVLLLCLATPTVAQELNCAEPVTQLEMTGCASRAAEEADGALNETWQLAIEAVKQSDAANPGYEPSSEEILREAQRSWISFRDQACSAEATIARGGSMASMLFLMCLERLTLRRTEDLRLFTTTN